MLSDKLASTSVASMPAEQRQVVSERWAAKREESIAQCAAGKTFDREDFECLQEAGDQPAIGRCMMNALQKKIKVGS